MKLNQCGKIAFEEWLQSSQRRTSVVLEEFAVMPNHFHAIVMKVESEQIDSPNDGQCEQFGRPTSDSLPSIIRGFKSRTTSLISRLPIHLGHPLWQRGYHEHVIRDESELQNIREYIKNNPLRWRLDKYFVA
jgi:REP element-mobilizing transposase RayT